MSLNQSAWEQEYQNPKLLITENEKPHAELVKFLKWLRKEKGVKDLAGWRVLDLGSGTGRNANFLAEKGCDVVGFEYSPTALKLAEQRAQENNLKIDYQLRDIGAEYPLPDNSVDLVLDITSSNSLDGEGRQIYLSEIKRVLKPGGYVLVRLLAKDGDKNAKWLLTNHPGTEADTYILPEVGLIERVFSRDDFNKFYGRVGAIEQLALVPHYTRLAGRIFKRNHWVAYIHKNES